MKHKIPEPKNGMQYLYEDIKEIADQFPSDYKWNYEELSKYIPEDLLVKVEIIHNRLFVYPSGGLEHSRISMNLLRGFYSFEKDNDLGHLLMAPFDVQLDENNIVQPDILFVAENNYKILEKAKSNGAPDLIVEIWLPMESKEVRNSKKNLYQKSKVKEFWQIYPKQKRVSIEVLNQNGKYEIFSEAKQERVVQSKVLEGFEVDVTDIFDFE